VYGKYILHIKNKKAIESSACHILAMFKLCVDAPDFSGFAWNIRAAPIKAYDNVSTQKLNTAHILQ
jgi:hypothetical protein